LRFDRIPAKLAVLKERATARFSREETKNMRIQNLVAVAALVGLGGSAIAQNESSRIDAYPYNLSIRGGVGLPIDENFRDFSKSLIAVGADYLLRRSLIKGGESYLSFDYIVKDTKNDTNRVIPIAINQKFYQGAEGEENRPYYFVGLGVTFVSENSSNTVLSGRAGIGLDLGERIFTEATLFLGDRAANIRPNLIGIYLGYKF
jgi:hypothetical protein